MLVKGGAAEKRTKKKGKENGANFVCGEEFSLRRKTHSETFIHSDCRFFVSGRERVCVWERGSVWEREEDRGRERERE
jgi:hypothetical protein